MMEGLAWADRGKKKLTTVDAILTASDLYKKRHGRWPNFVLLSPEEAGNLGDRLNGLRILSNKVVGKSYRLMVGWMEMEKA